MRRRLSWYARRLRAMSASEVAHRSGRTLRHGVDAASFHVARGMWDRRWHPAHERIVRDAAPEAPIGFLTAERGRELRARAPEDVDALLAYADAVLERRYRFFGYPEVVLEWGRGEDVDPFSGRRWPDRHAKRMDYRHLPAGDPKWIWELNRCQDLPALAAAWLASRDERYGRAAAAELSAWIDGHPPGRGIAWVSGFEAGLRAISLAVLFDALRGSELLPAPEVERVRLSLWQHGRWIERDPSTGSSANNHRIGELVGLVVLGSLVPELAAAEAWVSAGCAGLELEASAQIRPDGTSVEQAFGYHLFVLDLLLVAAAALECAGAGVPAAVDRALARSGDALWAQVAGEEPDPTYGDSDDSRALRVDGSDARTAREVAAAIAARLGDAEAAALGSRLDAYAWWLFGEAGASRHASVTPAPSPGSVLLPDGGLTILRAGRTRVAFDHGPHGYLALAAHAHADALAVDVSHGPWRLVGDPGVGSYARPLLRDAFRATAAHASVTVDDTSSSTPGGLFLWTRHARSHARLVDLEQRHVIAEHHGYLRLEDPVRHERAVAVVAPEAVLVLDRLVGGAAHRYAQRWPLGPELELEEVRDDGVETRFGDGRLGLAFAASRPLAVRARRGEEAPWSGWWSERLESVAPSLLIEAETSGASGEVVIATLLTIGRSDEPAEASLALEDHGDVVTLRLRSASTSATVDVDFASPAIDVRGPEAGR